MAIKTFGVTNGYIDISTVLSISADYALKDAEKRDFVSVTCSAASKKLTLGLGDADHMIVINHGDTNAITLKNVSDDEGTSLGAGEVALVIASTTTDGTKYYKLKEASEE